MRVAVLIARVLLGALFLFFGLNDLFHFLPNPPMSGDVGTMMGLMFSHGWVTFHGVLFVIAGIFLLSGFYVPLGLVILGPMLVNILLFHMTFMPQGFQLGLIATVLEVFLIWAYWPAFAGLFVAKPEHV